jgi:hypothetical protein
VISANGLGPRLLVGRYLLVVNGKGKLEEFLYLEENNFSMFTLQMIPL